ncbi:unnamed protein product [Brassica rapa subsp. trilocularis]
MMIAILGQFLENFARLNSLNVVLLVGRFLRPQNKHNATTISKEELNAIVSNWRTQHLKKQGRVQKILSNVATLKKHEEEAEMETEDADEKSDVKGRQRMPYDRL